MGCRSQQIQLFPEGTFREILSVAADTTKKDVAKSFKIITSKLEDEATHTAHVKDYMGRFVSQLGLKHAERVAAEDFALAACPPDGQ